MMADYVFAKESDGELSYKTTTEYNANQFTIEKIKESSWAKIHSKALTC